MLKTISDLINGHKTYILAVIYAIVVLVNHFIGPVPGVTLDPNNWIQELGLAAGIAAGRSAIKKSEPPKGP